MTALLFEGAARTAVPARPMVTRDMLAAQLARLADWHVQVGGGDMPIGACPALTAGHRLAGPAMATTFDALCDAEERLDDLKTGQYDLGPFEDPDDVDRDAREAYEDALSPLVDAAMVALTGGAR